MCGCSPTKKPALKTPKSLLSSSGDFPNTLDVVENGDPQQMVMVEYIGPVKETFTISSRISRDIRYRFGNNEQHRARTTFLSDAEYLIGLAGRDGKPMYRIISNSNVEGANDPTTFLGHPLVA